MLGVSRTGRRLRAALLAAALAFGVAAPVAMTATPAVAAGGGPYDDNGPGGDRDGNVTGGNGSGDFHCKGKYLYNGTVKAYDNPYPNCDPATNSRVYKRDGAIRLCPVGFQVFRFYGNYQSPAVSYNVSDLQLNTWCADEPVYSFWALSPADATLTIPGSPWFIRQDNNPYGPYVGGGHFSVVGRTEFGRLSAGVPYSSSGSCTSAQTANNPIAGYLANPDVAAVSKDATRQLFYNTYLSLSRNGAYPKTALAVLGLKSISKGATGKVSMSFDTKACSSPMDFISTADTKKLATSATERAKFKVTGTCYIPLDRMAYRLSTAGAPAIWGFPSLKATFGAGLRYSEFYKGTAYTAASPRGVGGKSPNAQEKAVLAKWRSTMASWYNAQPMMSGVNQSLPAGPYKLTSAGKPTGETQGEERTAARTALRDMSRCRFGSQVSFDASTTSEPALATLNLRMDNKEMFQAGGANRIQDITIRRDPIKCTSSPAVCSAALVKLTKLKYTVSVTSTAPTQYTECTSKVTAGCDYKITQPFKATTGAIQPDSTLRIVFFNPTMNPQKLKITISNISAQYQYQAQVGGIDMQLEDPISGGTVPFSSKGGSQPFLKALPVTATGNPVPLTKSGTSYVYQAPVIGAVDRTLD